MSDDAATPTLLKGGEQAPDDAGNAAAGGGGNGADDWRSMIPETYREKDWAKKYGSADDFFKGVDGMSQLIGKKEIVQGLQVPGEDAKPEDWDKFYADLGRPESADKYELPEVKPEFANFIREGDDAIWKEFAHKLGLNGKQAAQGFEMYGEVVAKLAAEMMPTEEKTLSLLEKEWGKDTRTNLQLAERAATALGLLEEVNESGLGLHPTVLKAFAKVGEMIGESKLPQLSSGAEPVLTKAKLQEMMRDPRYYDPAQREVDFVKAVEDGFKALYPDKKRS